jgi:small subunit ribosomal protein S6
MIMITRQYETVVVLAPGLEESVMSAEITKIENTIKQIGGKIIRRDDWGKRELSYEINRHKQGYYYLFLCEGQGSFVSELERQLKIMESVLRYLTVEKDKYAPDFVPTPDNCVTGTNRPDLEEVVEDEALIAS